LLAFTSVYFSESRLFNGLQPFGIKNPLSQVLRAMSPAASSSMASPARARRLGFCQGNACSIKFCFFQYFVADAIEADLAGGFPGENRRAAASGASRSATD
jgi:hypothetical protein